MKILFIAFFSLVAQLALAQTSATITANTDTIKVVKKTALKTSVDTTVAKSDSNKIIIDSTALLKKNNDNIITIKKDSLMYSLFLNYPILNKNKPALMITNFRQQAPKDLLFYLLLVVVLLLAIIRFIFPKYIKNIFAIILQTKFRQTQTRDQLVQDNVASMLLNMLFIFSSSIFIALITVRYQFTHYTFWQLLLAACILLIGIYIFKLFFTNFMGYIFNKPNAANAFNFIVFVVNKILGIAIIPLLFLIAFSSNSVSTLACNVSYVLIGVLLLFRLYLTYKNVSNILKINAIHFFLYFCSIEILPLLLIYKLLNNYVGNGI